MAKSAKNNVLNDLPLAAVLEPEVKAWAAVNWCKTASNVLFTDQPQKWEYFMLSEKTFNENRQLSFNPLAGLGNLDLERLLASEAGKLF